MKEQKHTFRNIVIFVLLICVTFYFIFKDTNVYELLDILKSTDKRFIAAALLLMCGYIGFESANTKRTMRKLGTKITPLQSVKYSMTLFFFSGITPAASGGQPMQIYSMHKDGLEIAKSTIGLLVSLFSYQIVTISVALVSVLFSLNNMDTGLRVFFVIGIGLNSIALTLLILGIFSKKMSMNLIGFIIKILKKFKYKKVEEVEKSLKQGLEKYQSCSTYISNNKKIMFKTIMFTFFQYMCYYSITYCIYRSLGLDNMNYFKIMSLQAVVYATTSGIPSPGAVGVSEAAYIGIFKTVIPENFINPALLLSRGINFYLPMLICGMVVIINTILSSRKKNKIDKKSK